MSQNLPISSPFRVFCFTSYKTNVIIIPNDSMQPLFKQIEIFLGILTALFNCKYFFKYTRELLVVPPRDFASSGRIPCGGGNKAMSLMITDGKSICLFSSHFIRTLAFRSLYSTTHEEKWGTTRSLVFQL